jgi:hypothetical protein
MNLERPGILAITTALALIGGGSEARAIEVLVNGDFETASFSGWTAGSTQTSPFQAALNDGQNAQIANSVSGQPAWYLRNKPAQYFSGSPATPIDNYGAFNGFDGSPGDLYLRQGFSIAGTLADADLSFDFAVQSNYNGEFRVFSINILDSAGALQTSVYSYVRPLGFLATWSPVNVALDLTSALNGLGAGNYQLEFLVDIPQSYTGPAQFAIDNISLDLLAATTAAGVPDGGPTLALLGGSLLLLGGAGRHLKPRGPTAA